MRPRERRSAGEKRLDHAQLADDVDVELSRQLVRWQKLERRGDCDPGVVDERVELVDARGRVTDGDRVGHVEDELCRPLGSRACATHRRVDRPAEIAQAERRRGADAGRRAGYEDSRDAATTARCSRPYPSAPSSQSARL
jgi:hypothetical protein